VFTFYIIKNECYINYIYLFIYITYLCWYIIILWKIVVLRTTGGEVAGGSTLAPKIGPLGLVNIKNRYYNNEWINK